MSVADGNWFHFYSNVPHEEPTRSVNTDLAIALVVFIVVHFNGMFKNGILGYLKGYWGDVIPCKGWWLLLAPINIMIPLNIISEVSSVISHSFRLFGNIFRWFYDCHNRILIGSNSYLYRLHYKHSLVCLLV